MIDISATSFTINKIYKSRHQISSLSLVVGAKRCPHTPQTVITPPPLTIILPEIIKIIYRIFNFYMKIKLYSYFNYRNCSTKNPISKAF